MFDCVHEADAEYQKHCRPKVIAHNATTDFKLQSYEILVTRAQQ